MKKDAGKKIVAERVEEFERNKAILTKKGHGETNIRSNYIDVLFHALGWDMKSHYEVVREFSQRDKSTESGTKKVDYAFKINGKLKFFIEAKEASIDLEKDKSSIFQAKRYAYSSNGKAPIVILTDFEELRVFNVIKAPLMDNTDRELLKSHSMKYTEYLDKWDLLWDTFSKEAVENGSLDKLRGKIDKNTKTMDIDFLEQITEWRELLAKNIANRNKDLTVDEINEAVQRILDRLVFIRNLEDREIEPENTLLDKTKKSENIYKSIIPVFNALDKTYNGLLFKKHFSESIDIDDKTIKDIIRNMSYPVSPFQFDVIEPEILGRIYEKFLGSKIRLTANHQAKIEEKIEVRKAGGVYYTPEYIVEYIVANTVGKKIEGLNPEEIKKIKIVDPACGSGSFLIGAYSYLLEYHQKWYSANQKIKSFQADWYKTKDGEINVSLDKRSDILRNNIFGVDIDKEATEVAIMSLYLKMLDDGFDKGEKDLFFVKGSILPDMVNNIKCGNSLIGTDYYDGLLEINTDEIKELKPFNWENEFINIFRNGGFDCVIGNPPYHSVKLMDDLSKSYFYKSYYVGDKRFNLFSLFIERTNILLNPKGLMGYIIPNSFLANSQYLKLRDFIISNYVIQQIVNFDGGVFNDATVETLILILQNEKNQNERESNTIEIIYNIQDLINKNYLINNIKQVAYHNENKTFFIQEANQHGNFYLLKNITEILNGINTGNIADKIIVNEKINDKCKPIIDGKDIQRYEAIQWRGSYVVYDEKYVDKLRAEWKKKGLDWTARIIKKENYFEREKLIIQRIRNLSLKRRLVLTYDDKNYYTSINIGVILLKPDCPYSLKFILGILNSNYLNHYYSKKFHNIQIKNIFLEELPIPILDLANPEHFKIHSTIESFVEQMLNAQIDLCNSKSESDKKIFEEKIKIIDNKIDAIVFKLYDISEDEIKLIES